MVNCGKNVTWSVTPFDQLMAVTHLVTFFPRFIWLLLTESNKGTKMVN